jgi:TnpA family transposase
MRLSEERGLGREQIVSTYRRLLARSGTCRLAKLDVRNRHMRLSEERRLGGGRVVSTHRRLLGPRFSNRRNRA